MQNWASGGQNTEDFDRKSLDSLQQAVSRIMDANDSANKNSEGNEEQREIRSHFRGYQNRSVISKNVDIKVAITEGSEGNEHVIGNQGKGDLCSIVAESSVELCFTVMWKVGCFNYDLELRRFPSRVESATLLLFAAYKLRGKLVK